MIELHGENRVEIVYIFASICSFCESCTIVGDFCTFLILSWKVVTTDAPFFMSTCFETTGNVLPVVLLVKHEQLRCVEFIRKLKSSEQLLGRISGIIGIAALSATYSSSSIAEALLCDTVLKFKSSVKLLSSRVCSSFFSSHLPSSAEIHLRQIRNDNFSLSSTNRIPFPALNHVCSLANIHCFQRVQHGQIMCSSSTALQYTTELKYLIRRSLNDSS